MLQLREIKKDYVTSSETVQALKGVSISFRKKEFVSILGPSGCGKTTLLNIIGGLDHYTSGDLIIGGRSTKSYTDRDWDVYRNHRIGFIFQSYNLIPHQTVLGNVELALTISGVSREERIRRAKNALDRVGLSGQYYKRPNQLSGGQCQRVAIARALVNDPEILLADEPTGALDTVTSVQIMDLIKEISGERLVIMVTHNPEIADQYSSRIIRLLDGNVIEDTNPFSPEDEERECTETAAEEKRELDEALSAASTEKERKKIVKEKKEKAKMSFFTAFMLSAKNLLSKKGRTAMVGIAGSIGIIGIALVLAFSAGIKGYIASMQDDMLSGNPIEIAETAYDLQALTGMMEAEDVEEIIKENGKIYVSSLVEYLAKMGKDIDTLIVENTLTKEYIEYVTSMPSDYYSAMLVSYGIDLNANLYRDFCTAEGAEPQNISISAITSIYSSILQETEFKEYASLITTLAPSFSQLPNNPDYVLSQYDLVGGGKMATEKGEIMLVLNPEDELSDLLLARFGFYTQEQFLEIVNKATDDPDYNAEKYKNSFDYSELIGAKFDWYPNDVVFNEISIPGLPISTFTHIYNSENFAEDVAGKETLTVVGILTPKDNVNFGSVSSGIYYTEAFANHVLSTNIDADGNYTEHTDAFFDHIKGIDESNATTAALMNYYLPYSYEYTYEGVTKTVTGYIAPPMSMDDMMSSFMGGSSDGSAFDHTEMKERIIRAYGGNGVANKVLIYPTSFDEKNLVTEYLDKWNSETGSVVVGDVEIPAENRLQVTYTDALELIVDMINTMIDVVSYALIAFTSVSLVVSTVMIGIITFVSVVERIKEIGVIRSLGGRKKDVSHLFNAETFIIGLLAGLIGVGVTYLISIVVNLILEPYINYARIAALPFGQAVLLVALSIGLTLISGLIPAKSAANRDPVVALRTE